jgi:hypothetical protein
VTDRLSTLCGVGLCGHDQVAVDPCDAHGDRFGCCFRRGEPHLDEFAFGGWFLCGVDETLAAEGVGLCADDLNLVRGQDADVSSNVKDSGVGEATVKRPRDLGAWIVFDALGAVAAPGGPLTPVLDSFDNRGAIAKRNDVSDVNHVVTPHGELVCLVTDDDRVDEARHGGIIA